MGLYYTAVLRKTDTTELNKTSIMSLEYSDDAQTEEDVSFGSVVSASIAVTLRGNLLNGVQPGETLQYYQVDESNNRTLIGHFLVEKPEMASANTYRFNAYDSVSLLDKDVTAYIAGLTFPVTLLTLAQGVCTYCGTTFDTATFPNSSYAVKEFSLEGITGRQVMGMIATLAGRFVRAKATGNIEFGWYNTLNNVEVAPTLEDASPGVTRVAYYADSLIHNYFQTSAVTAMRYVLQEDGETTYVTYPAAIDPSYNTMQIGTNILLNGATTAQIRTILQNLLNEINPIVYVPCSFRVPQNQLLHAGDIVAVEDANGYTFNTLIMHYKWGDGGIDCSSTGNGNRGDLASTVSRSTESAPSTQIVTQQAVERVSMIFSPEATPANPVLTDGFVELVGDAINITGFVTFTDLSQSGQSTINGSNITTGKITSDDGDVIFDLDNSFLKMNWDATHFMKLSTDGLELFNGNTKEGGLSFQTVNNVTFVDLNGYHMTITAYDAGDTSIYSLEKGEYGGEFTAYSLAGNPATIVGVESGETGRVITGMLTLNNQYETVNSSSTVGRSAGTIYGIYNGSLNVGTSWTTISIANVSNHLYGYPRVLAMYATTDASITSGNLPTIKVRSISKTSFQICHGGSSGSYPVNWIAFDIA